MERERPIYLDYNATTPVDPAVAEAMLPYLTEHFGNPSCGHVFGRTARRAVDEARGQVAALLGAKPREIVFTSGGSESNNTAINGVARARREEGRHLVSSAVEHPAVLEPLAALEADGFETELLPVDSRGRVDPAGLVAAIRADTTLVTVMHANNEVGTLQPVPEIARIAHANGALVHTDAAQSVGKVPVSVDDLGVDLLSVAGHKVYGPKGIGALYVRSGVEIPPLIHGASHESGRRAGTENVLEIVGLGKACELAREGLAKGMDHARSMRDRLLAGLETITGDVRVNGDLETGLPNTLNVSLPGVDASALLARVGDRLAASGGAACHAEGVTVSTVLRAMGVSCEMAVGTMRFSVGRFTTQGDIDRAVEILGEALRVGGA